MNKSIYKKYNTIIIKNLNILNNEKTFKQRSIL